MRTEWALRYERADAPRMDNPSGEVTVEMVMPEQNARWSVERGIVRRQVTEWEEVVEGEAIQQVDGGKWHRVWWPAYLEDAGTVMTHVGSYKPDRHERRLVSEVPEVDRCRICLPPAPTSSGGDA